MESSWITTESIFNEGILIRSEDIQRHRGSDAEMEADFWKMYLQAEECQGLPVPTRGKETNMRQIFPQSFQKEWPLQKPWFWISGFFWIGEKKNHVVSSHHVCGNLLWLPRTNTVSLIRKSLILAIQYRDLLKWFYFFWEKTPSICTFRDSEAWLDNTELNVLNPIWQKPHKY